MHACLYKTENIYLDKCKKNVYLGHRQFVPPKHQLRKRGKHFNGEVKADTRSKPIRRTGDDVFNMVKDLKVIFGNGPGRQPVLNDPSGHAPM
jgi:hypothetical protein